MFLQFVTLSLWVFFRLCLLANICFEHRSLGKCVNLFGAEAKQSKALLQKIFSERKHSRSRSKSFKKLRPLKKRPVEKGCHWSGLSRACLVTLSDIETNLHALWKAVASALRPAAGGHDAEDTKDQERLEITGNVGHSEIMERLVPKQQSHYRTAHHIPWGMHSQLGEVWSYWRLIPLEAFCKLTAS